MYLALYLVVAYRHCNYDTTPTGIGGRWSVVAQCLNDCWISNQSLTNTYPLTVRLSGVIKISFDAFSFFQDLKKA